MFKRIFDFFRNVAGRIFKPTVRAYKGKIGKDVPPTHKPSVPQLHPLSKSMKRKRKRRAMRKELRKRRALRKLNLKKGR